MWGKDTGGYCPLTEDQRCTCLQSMRVMAEDAAGLNNSKEPVQLHRLVSFEDILDGTF